MLVPKDCFSRVTCILVLLDISGATGGPAKKKNAQQNKKANNQPLKNFFQEVGQIFNPVQWFQQQVLDATTESPNNVVNDSPLIAQYVNSLTGRQERYTTGSTQIDKTITSFFGALTQIMDNTFKTFVTPAMNGTIWDDTPRPNGSGGLSNFLSSFFCQIFLGLLSPNYNGKQCLIYKNSTANPIAG